MTREERGGGEGGGGGLRSLVCWRGREKGERRGWISSLFLPPRNCAVDERKEGVESEKEKKDKFSVERDAVVFKMSDADRRRRKTSVAKNSRVRLKYASQLYSCPSLGDECFSGPRTPNKHTGPGKKWSINCTFSSLCENGSKDDGDRTAAGCHFQCGKTHDGCPKKT